MPDRQALTRGLGWFSVALGAGQLAAPNAMSRLIGVRSTNGTRAVMRAVGVREVTAGVVLLARRPGFLWARVAGDAMDLALLGNALTSRSDKTRARAAAAAVVGVAALDVAAARRNTRGDAVKARTAITVNAPPQEVYARWRDLDRLPEFMYHLESVTTTGSGRSHWVAKAPGGTTVQWDAEITEDEPGRRLSWRSIEGSEIENSGTVRFLPAPKGQGTEIHVELSYAPPGGAVGAAVAKLFGEEPDQQVADDLRRFKQLVETGEIARSDGSPMGSRTQNQLRQRDANPPEGADLRRARGEEVSA
ncbi:MAG: SRPBCC family protein [Acidimicrobiia bacterium]